MKKPSPVKIYNTLTKKKDPVQPLSGNKVNLFVCGPTVYDFMHIGNARTFVFFDIFAKYLGSQGFKVNYVQNITDIDDKIIQRAREKGVDAKELAETFFQEYLKDMDRLHVTGVKKYAKATDYIKPIISQVQRLQEKGFAYPLEDGIYFDISKFERYGSLSGRTVLQAEDSVSRIDYHKSKRNRGDFALWKFAVAGEPSWKAPFGAGRPGWHIEDTAITEKFFGPQYDIHGGGRDLIFPHHEAEVTQMEAVSGKKPMAAYWMHTGFLTVDGQKMSKSLDNFIKISDFLRRYPYQQLRFRVAKSLWHSPIDYSESVMIEVKMSLDKIEEFLRKLQTINKNLPAPQSFGLQKAEEDFYGALADDFNTPKAFASLFEFIKETNKLLDQDVVGKKEAKEITKLFIGINKIFDIIDFKKLKTSNVPAEVQELVKARETARKNAEWAKSDELRDEITKYGYSVDDTKDGTVLKKM